MDVEYIYISEAMLEEARANPELEIVGEPKRFPLTKQETSSACADFETVPLDYADTAIPAGIIVT